MTTCNSERSKPGLFVAKGRFIITDSSLFFVLTEGMASALGKFSQPTWSSLEKVPFDSVVDATL
jgi:hypothetical protein